MNVSTIIISQDEALQKLEQYKSIQGKRRLKEDDKLQSLYKSISKGARVINIANAFRETGLNEERQPKLAIARADWREVFCYARPYVGFQFQMGSCGFTCDDGWNYRATARNLVLPENSFNLERCGWTRISSPVPHIPPDIRPKFGLHNYHILFEVKEWRTYPVDPFLLRRISGMLFVVEAEWELTELEASLLQSMQQGN